MYVSITSTSGLLLWLKLLKIDVDTVINVENIINLPPGPFEVLYQNVYHSVCFPFPKTTIVTHLEYIMSQYEYI